MTTSKSDIVFCGTPGFSAEILNSLLEQKQPITHVITMPDRPSGRGYQVTSSPVKVTSQSLGIAIYQPENQTEFAGILKSLNPRVVIVIAYGMIFPEEVTRNYFLMNLHVSLLPKYRGASPIQSAILNGDKMTGITLFRINKGVDTGDIIAQTTIPIEPQDTTTAILEKCRKASPDLIVQQLNLPMNEWTLTPQNEADATMTKKISREDGQVDLTRDDPVIVMRKLRAYTPWPGVFTFWKDKRVKLIKADIVEGKLKPLIVQVEGKKAVSYDNFINAYGPLIP